MLIDPSESLDASPKRSTFEAGRFAGGADPLEGGGDPDLGLGESTEIGAGFNPEKGGTLLDDLWRRNEKRDPDKAAKVSSSEKSNAFVSERGGSLAESFCSRLLPAWQTDRLLPVVARVDEAYADPE